MHRRTFLGAAVAAVAGLVAFGFARKRAAKEIVGSGRETVRADKIVPARLCRFNRMHSYSWLNDKVHVSVSRPPSDLDWTVMHRELGSPRIVQDEAGACCLLRPTLVQLNRGRGTVRWEAELCPA